MKNAFFGLTSVLALTVSGGFAQEAPREMDGTKLAEIDARVGALVSSGKVAGAVTLIARDGKIVQSGAYGVRDIKTGEEMTQDTIFRIYSMTKPIVTAAAMMLVDAGKIGFDDPISKHLPKLANPKVYRKDGEHVPAKREPTVRDLMRHTSGFSYGFVGGAVSGMYNKLGVIDRETSLDAMVDKLAGIPLQEEPGTVWRYSISIDVLGAVVQAASGERLEKFLAKQIFEPLGMVDTAFHVAEDKRGRFASQHGRTISRKLKVSEPASTSHYLEPAGLASGGGGLVSTAADYFRFCQMILNGGQLDGKRLLKEETVAAMAKNQLPDGIDHIGISDVRSGVGFGLGFSVRTAESKWGFGGKTGEIGWGGAASTHFWMLPKEGLVVITMRNFMPYQWTLEKELKKLVYDAL